MENRTETVYFDDGSYMTVEVTRAVRASGSVTGSKPYTYYNSSYNSSGVVQWQAVLTGSFTYTGSSATCTASSVDVTVYDSAWKVISKSASKSENTATASVSMRKVVGVTVMTVPVSMSLSCDANGNLS